MKWILLDIDGVMVPIRPKVENPIEDGFPPFSKGSVKALNSLIKEDTAVVLTTSHKSNYRMSEWKRMFKLRGIVDISIFTRLSKGNSKMEELLLFLENFKDPYVLIDDDKSLNELPEKIKERLALISPMIGLTEKDVNNIENLFNNK